MPTYNQSMDHAARDGWGCQATTCRFEEREGGAALLRAPGRQADRERARWKAVCII